MIKRSKISTTLPTIFSMLIACLLLLPQSGFGASTTTILRQIGSGAATASGDYISSNQGVGLDLTYRYYIEVPAGTANLTVEIWDADIGAVTLATNYTDWLIGSLPYNTSCRYTLNRPNTTNAIAVTYDNTQVAADSVWTQIYTVASPAAGHWELIVDMSSAVTAGNDVNGYGIRAHDGTAGAGGTELPVYAESFLPLGHIGANPSSATTNFYPYITSGCTVDWNDFDGDDNGAGAYCQLTYASRNGALPTTTYNGAGNDVWLNRAITGFQTDVLNSDMGIWTATARYTNLSGSTANFGVFWAGNWQAANGAPSAQPQANSFRLYLPTDGGGAPLKPYLTQRIVYVSGANPPHHGAPHAATYMRVLIDFVNPTTCAVTFSAANLVTARVPGTKVLYRGSAYAWVSQGSIVTQPAAGGSGNITWNPGMVAAGATTQLYYEVGVTPTVNDERIIVTGTPAANGTSARYVDETGNTTQTRATFTFGPLCELAVTEDSTVIPTWVAISCFEADMASGEPTVEWHTAAEHGTLGFYLWRKDSENKDYQLVNPDLLPALVDAKTGGIYRLVDPDARYGETVVYRLEEINAHGDSLKYGPFKVTFDDTPAKLQETDNFYKKNHDAIETHGRGFQRAAFAASKFEKNRQQARRHVLQTRRSLRAIQGRGQARIAIKSQGLFRIDSASIAAALGMSAGQVEGLIAFQQLSLSNMGEQVAWLADANRSGIYFYGEKLQSPYSDENIYWLEKGRGLALDSVNSGAAAPANASQTFNAISHFEESHYALTYLYSNPGDDFWFWDYVVAGSGNTSFPVQVQGRAIAGTATLTVNLQGATDTAAANDHHVQVVLNGTQIGESSWDGITAHSCQFSFDQSLLNDGGNTIVVSGVLASDVPYSIFYVDSFDLSYQRYYQAVNNTLWCQGAANQTISVTGFSDAQVMVWDVSQPRRPKLVNTAAVDQSGRITFNPAAPANKYLLVGRSAVLQPFSLNGVSTANLKRNNNSAEYLLIAPEEFANEARQLADYRRGQGLDAMVVTLEDIYNSFNWGLASPLAVKDFLDYAYSRWNGKGLKYVVLVGKGTHDYKDYLGYGDNLVPAMMANTSDGLFAADNLYGDMKGNDGIPEIAIGRLPVVSVEELQTVINKIKAYGSSQGPWTDKALMIADNADSGGDFLSTTDNLSKLLNGYAIERISLLGNSNAAESRLAIIAAFNAGAALVNYVGHAGLNQLAEENIFNISDLPLLQNNSSLPIMTLLTCAAGRFDIPGYVCLSEALLLKDNGGIVSALVPSGASFNSDAGLLFEEFYKAVFRGKEKDLGTAWCKAAKKYVQQGGKPYILNIYNLLGDPAVMFK